MKFAGRGVCMVQVYFRNFQPWDSHDDIRAHADLAMRADGPIASLNQNSGLDRVCNGRDHNVHGHITLLAGGGVRGRMA